MWFARYLITETARRLILDREFRDRAADTYRRAAPKVAAVGKTVSSSIKESPPVKDPAEFGRAAGKRVGAVIRRFRADSRPD